MISFIIQKVYAEDIIDVCKAIIKQDFFSLSKISEPIRFIQSKNKVECILKSKMPTKFANFIFDKISKQVDKELLFWYKIYKIHYNSEK